jgi:NADH:ubiquinone oxidoreductase subunit 4 (subunit M)
LLAEYHPGFALLFLFGTALGGAALFRAHAKVFWGKPGPTLSVHGAFSLRLLPREAVGVGLLVAAIFGIGCAPQGILSLFPGHSQESSVEATRPIFSSLR